MTGLSLTLSRLRSAGRPTRILRSLAAAVTTVAAAPLLVILSLLLYGSIVGTGLTQTALEAVTWAASVIVILTLLAVLDLLFGVVAVARIQLGDRLGAGLLGALRVMPRLLVALPVIIVAIVLLVLASPLLVVVALGVALVRKLRGTPGVRRALTLAIPLLPAVVAVAMLPASIAAAIEGPRSIRELLRAAGAIVRRRKRALLAFVLTTAAISAGLTWVGTSSSTALEVNGFFEASLLAVASTLALLIVAVGAILAVALPPAELPPRAVSGRVRSRLISRVAVAVTASLVVSLLPFVAASPASAVGLITPVLTQNFDAGGHTVTLSADVTVPAGDPNGSVQFFDGTTPFGAPLRVTRSGSDPDSGIAQLPGHPVISPGSHSFFFTFTPDSSLVEPGSSVPRAWHVTATTLITLTADPAAAVGGSADVTVSLEADYATSVRPTGTVLVEWEGGSTDVTLVGGVGTTTIAYLPSAGITATYAGSADFTAASTSIEIGVVVEPEDTVITASFYGTVHPFGGNVDAVVSVVAPGAPFGTVRGGVRVYSGSTLLADNAEWTDPLVIPTTAFHAGALSLRFVFVPGAGFSASETTEDIELAPATSSVSAVLSNATTTWGDALSLDLTIASSANGQRSVEVRDTRTSTVVATRSVDITGGTASTSIDLSSSLRPGGYTLVATVLGDTDHAAASSGPSTSSVGSARTTTQISLSANPAQTGQLVTITATTTSAAGLPNPLPGRVYFRLPDGSQEDVAVTGGSASLEWTPGYAMTGNVTASYFDSSFLFAGSSTARSITVIQALAPSPCVFPTFMGTPDLSRAVRCGTGGLGIRAGSLVTLAATPRAGYVIDGWTVNGLPTVPGATPVVTIESSAAYRYSERYAPVCFTLTLSPLRDDRATAGGYVTNLTRPNCSSPINATTAELAEAAAGRPRYAAGTTVEVSVSPNYVAPNSGGSELVIDTLTGATLLNDRIAQLVMNGNRTVAAVFKVKACTPVSVVTTEGGTVAVTSATRPASPSGLQPATGACTTANGSPGYVPGTELTFTATPNVGASVFAWNVATVYPYLATVDTEMVAVGSTSNDPAAPALTRKVTVPADTLLQVAAHFAGVRCVSVTIISRALLSPNNTITVWNAPKGATGTAYGTEENCGGVASTRTVTLSGSRWYRIVTETKSYVATGRVDVTTAQRTYVPAGLNVGMAYVLWDTSTTQGVDNKLVGPASADGPFLDLAELPAQVTVRADWVIESAAECFAPHVALPQGGSFILKSKYADEPFCENPDFVAKTEQLSFRAAMPVGAPALTPILSGGGMTQYTMPATILGSQWYTLEYCTPFTLDVRIHDDAGAIRAATAEEAKWLFDDNGGCPQGWTRPNLFLATGLSGSGAVNYVVVGNPAGLGPILAVSPTGVVSGANRVDLQVICFTLNVYDASISTTGNCPGGGANRFLRGTQVQVQAGESDRFDGWDGVDAEQGESAWVIMDRDRSVSADLHFYKWYEKAGNALSSVAQRAAASIVTYGTGLVLSQAYLVKATAWALSGTASLLRAVGVNGAFVDAVDSAGKIVFAQLDAISLLAQCMSGAATGDGAALLTIPANGTTVPPGGSADAAVAAAKAQLAQQLSAAGVNGAVSIPGGKAGAYVNLFGSGLGGYTADASSSWGNYGSSIGSCMQRGAENYVNETYNP